jgi:phosphate transport system protein
MERRFEVELKELKNRILAMGGFVEQAVELATQALTARSALKLPEIRLLENRINEAHVEIDGRCLELLARQSPVAADLRLILAIIKINTDLERMGDQAINISYNVQDYSRRDRVELDLNLPHMSANVRVMVRDSLDAFMREDTGLAQKVLESDDEIDRLKNQVFKDLIPYMRAAPEKIEAALDLILIARNLERMADHATNIAEDVIFAFTGEDVRHGIGQIG